MRNEQRRRTERRGVSGGDRRPAVRAGREATSGELRLRSFQIGALPLVNHFLRRLDFERTLRAHLPPDDVRQELPTERILALLVRNLLVSREPLYGIPDWVARHAPELCDLDHCDLPRLHDDRLGASLERLATATTPEMLLALARTAIRVFGVSLDELHNDSTTIAFHGAYASAAAPRVENGREQPAITWGHSKDRRPDLKQLLFMLTLARDLTPQEVLAAYKRRPPAPTNETPRTRSLSTRKDASCAVRRPAGRWTCSNRYADTNCTRRRRRRRANRSRCTTT